ncbi:hypothetical protein XMIN_39 [Xanthomonas citri pv. mangiferaeindicae LMG 941]|nr:hypothetical protein XMIN_39 [Xanthomonas citri pv. mangiferaeindicae LMG 941]
MQRGLSLRKQQAPGDTRANAGPYIACGALSQCMPVGRDRLSQLGQQSPRCNQTGNTAHSRVYQAMPHWWRCDRRAW